MEVNKGQTYSQKVAALMENHRQDMLETFCQWVAIPSFTGSEETLATAIHQKMLDLDYDQVWQDKWGNIIGVVGHGDTALYFDCHMDVVGVSDADQWVADPFGGQIIDGNVYGRGSADMKSGLVSAMYAAAIAKQAGGLEGKKIYVAATVMEEDLDGVATGLLLDSLEKLPDFAIMCEPTKLDVGIGHKGRALTKITVQGKASHGSRPDLGINPTYLLSDLLKRVEAANIALQAQGEASATMAVTTIGSETDSFNSVPRTAHLYIDHRLTTQDTPEAFAGQMEQLIAGLDATWEICDFPAKTWTGEDIVLHSMHQAWSIPKDHTLATVAQQACHACNRQDSAIVMLGFATNAVTTAGKLGIPSIVLGPGDVAYAHMRDERCPIVDLYDACSIYAHICNSINH